VVFLLQRIWYAKYLFSTVQHDDNMDLVTV